MQGYITAYNHVLYMVSKWVNQDRYRRLSRESMDIHTPDFGHRRVARARFGRTVRIIQKGEEIILGHISVHTVVNLE